MSGKHSPQIAFDPEMRNQKEDKSKADKDAEGIDEKDTAGAAQSLKNAG